jgi:hypothetical protein
MDPPGMDAFSPPGRTVASTTVASSTSMVMTTSRPSQTSASDAVPRAPASTSLSTAPRETS